MSINVTREEFETLERRLHRNTSRLYQDLRGSALYGGAHDNPTIYVPFKSIEDIPMGTIFYFKSATNTPVGDTTGVFSLLFTNPEDDLSPIKQNFTYLGELRTNRHYALTLTTENNVKILEFHDGALAEDINNLKAHRNEITNRFSLVNETLTLSGGNQKLSIGEILAASGEISNNFTVNNVFTSEFIKLPTGAYTQFHVGTDESGIVTNNILSGAVDTAVEAALENKIRIDGRTPQVYQQETGETLPDGILYFQVNMVFE